MNDNNKTECFKALNSITDILDTKSEFEYIALIEIDGIIDTYLLSDIGQETLRQFAWYLYNAFDFRHIESNQVKLIPLIAICPSKVIVWIL